MVFSALLHSCLFYRTAENVLIVKWVKFNKMAFVAQTPTILVECRYAKIQWMFKGHKCKSKRF